MERSQLKLSQINQRGTQVLNCTQKPQQSSEIIVKRPRGHRSSYHLQNNGFQHYFEEQSDLSQCEQLKNIKCWKVALIAITVLQFSIKISLILIQYLSSKISISLFCSLASIILFLALLVILSLSILSIRKIKQFLKAYLKSHENSNQSLRVEVIHTTQPKIATNQENATSQKTAKVMSLFIGEERQNEQTSKNLEKEREMNRKETDCFFSGLSLNTNLQIIITAKVLQNTASLIGCVFIFCSISNPFQFGFGQAQLLLIISFTLFIFSTAFLITLSLKIKHFIVILGRKIKETKKQPFKKHTQFVSIHPKGLTEKAQTVLSIDNYIPKSTILHNKSKIQLKKTENTIKSKQHTQKPKHYLNQIAEQALDAPKVIISYSQHKIKDENFKVQLRIVNKPTIKSYKNRSTKFQGLKTNDNRSQFNNQRRKVEINSKKIQYFQYATVSPGNSLTHSRQLAKKFPKSIFQKSKIYSQRARNFIVKKSNEDLLLQRHKQLNIKRSLAKSARSARSAKERELSQKRQVAVTQP